jgi:hypothetical protein
VVVPEAMSVAATIASAEKRRSSGASVSPPVFAAPVDGAAAAGKRPSTAVPGKNLTPQTQRGGEFSPTTADPSGTKGAEVKHPPGSVRLALRSSPCAW